MALAALTLSDALELNMTPGEADPVAKLAESFEAYMSTAAAILVTTGCEAAMLAAMTFTAGDSAAQGAAQFASGLAAYWNPIVAAPATYFPGAIAVVPPTYAGVAAALAADFDTNTTGSVSFADSMISLGATMHTHTLITPFFTMAGPINIPIV